ncbi:hypothetical protein AB0B30_28795 [Streptomyces narbonensis]|uniref:Uncharacterized protein n=1 Tax=Streptomyces narbonensis TaxID=67333 RepID=A0ABV3CI40_9ACTN
MQDVREPLLGAEALKDHEQREPHGVRPIRDPGPPPPPRTAKVPTTDTLTTDPRTTDALTTDPRTTDALSTGTPTRGAPAPWPLRARGALPESAYARLPHMGRQPGTQYPRAVPPELGPGRREYVVRLGPRPHQAQGHAPQLLLIGIEAPGQSGEQRVVVHGASLLVGSVTALTRGHAPM